MNYVYDFASVFRNADTLIDGLSLSLEIAAAANLIAVFGGFVIALLLLSPSRLIRLPATLFVEFFRCTPFLVQIFWFFYCVPMLLDVYLSSRALGILALSLILSTFNAEAFRGAVQAVPRDQIDAGIALGLSPFQRVAHIIFPTALRLVIPVLLTNGILAFQTSSLLSLVAVEELMFSGKMLSAKIYRPIETFTVVALIYLVVSLPVSQWVGWLERRRVRAER
ncbi:MAG: amino acid ABC transporter permease [Azospirillaceae bacterium]|nr:amino acid ABC transporter permease [Azospirillaceae bacterium]